MIDSVEAVAVDSGMILMVDPCYLFTSAEWGKICKRAHDSDEKIDIEDCILEALKLKKKGDDRTFAVCRHTEHGDGRYKVERTDSGLVIRGA